MTPWAQFKQLLADFGLEYFNRYYSTYRGFVESNEDPENLGRLKLKIPTIYGSKVRDYWAWPVGLYCGNNSGQYFIPEKGDMVFVRFENGDPDYPIWEYGHWNKVNKKPAANSPKQKVLQTPSGLRIEFDDSGELIKIGMGGTHEPAVLGDKNEDVLEGLRSSCESATNALLTFATSGAAATASGPLTPLNPSYSTLASSLPSILTQLIQIQQQIPQTKSEIVEVE